jgi:hypothetical protein
VNAKQNYSATTGSIWLTNQRGVWIESPGRTADYGENTAAQQRGENAERADMFNDVL